MRGKLIGLGIFIVVALLAVGLYLFGNHGPAGSPITVKGYVGGEKMDFLQDPQVVKLLKDKYNITLDITKAGSIEMIDLPADGVDFLFPSSQTALEIFEAKGKVPLKKERIFSSPIVFYTWSDVYTALEAQGIVERQGETNYIKNLDQLIDDVNENKKWSDIGLNLYGSMKIISTDPTKSNSGMMLTALIANTLNHGQVPDNAAIGPLLPQIQAIFAKLGQMESSSSNLFSRYLTLGMGDSPIIAGYENQIIEFALANPEVWNQVKDRIELLYPEPTVWSDHYFIALSENGKRLCDALLDEDIQKLAWQKHGFRTRLVSYQTDQNVMDTVGIPDSITQVIPVPNAQVMETIQDYLANQ